MSQFRALIVASPGCRGLRAFAHALNSVDFESEILTVNELFEYKIDQDQLCLKYKVVVLPGGNTYSNVLGAGKALAIQLVNGLGWNLARFAEKGGLVLGVANGFQTLLHMKAFGKDFAFRLNESAQVQECWMKVTPTGNRSIWLRGLGTMELPLNQMDTEFVIDPFAMVEAKGRLERLGLSCLKEDGTDKVVGLSDPTGLILGLLPHPEYFLSWTNMEDWYENPTRAAAPGQGFALFRRLIAVGRWRNRFAF